MAESSAAANTPAPSGGSNGGSPKLFIILAIINMLVVIGVGGMLYVGAKKKNNEAGIDDVIKGESEKLKEENKNPEFIGKLVPLESIMVNIAGSRGRKLVKMNMELEVTNTEVQEEIEKVKPKIRDFIIIITSSKTFAEISTKEGKDALRDEIINQVNLFLTKGQITKVYFTEFILN